jgi:glycosyltransferase involved in cell wall biosynthesis
MFHNHHALPRITIATVVYNGRAFIRDTLESVSRQTYPNLEYIVIDGSSSDGSLDIIEGYSRSIDRLISEPDGGIYDAMNKALSLSTGDWILFMNAGDTFCSPETVSAVFAEHMYNPNAILYGSHYAVCGPSHMRLIQAPVELRFWQGCQFSHQACFVPVKYHKAHPYDITFRIAADYDFFLNAKRRNMSFQLVPIPIACIIPGGVSDIMRSVSVTERSRSLDSPIFSLLYFPLLSIYNSLAISLKRFIGLLLGKVMTSL